MYGQPTHLVAPSGASFEQQKHHLMRQQEMERARQAAHVNRVGLMSAAMFLVGAYLKKPLLGAVAGGAYFWMNHPEGGKKTSGRRTEGPAQMTEKEGSFRYGKGGVSHHGSCPPGMFDPGTGSCIPSDPLQFDSSSLPWVK